MFKDKLCNRTKRLSFSATAAKSSAGNAKVKAGNTKAVLGKAKAAAFATALRLAAVMAAVILFGSVIGPVAGGAHDVYAAEAADAFAIEKYEMEAVVSKDHTYKIKQRLKVNLPQSIDSLKLVMASEGMVVTDINAGDIGFVTQAENGTQYITLTLPQQMTEGNHEFVISYVVNETAENDEEKDMFYFNALLPEWRQPIGEIDINVSMPEDFVWDNLEYYAGKFGISDDAGKLKVDMDEKAGTVSIKGSRIPANYGITLLAELPDGYWEEPLDGSIFVRACTILIIVLTFVCFVLWLIGGRDPRSGRVKQTHPIEGISPAELGFLFEGKVTKRDIIALILYLGTKGYLRISEYKPRKFRLYRLEDPKGEEKFIRNAYNILFENIYKGRYIELEDAGSRLRRILMTIPVDIENGFSANDMKAHTPMSKVFRVISAVIAVLGVAILPLINSAYRFIDISYVDLGIVLVLAAASMTAACVLNDRSFNDESNMHILLTALACAAYTFVFGYQLFLLARASHDFIYCLVMTACYILMLVLVLLMKARGKENAKLVAKYRSLRRFIYKAEPKDVEEFYRENPDYYYDMVPYAYLFQGLESWARTFRWMDVADPVWYTEDIEGHAIAYAKHKNTTFDNAKAIKSFCRTLESGYISMQRLYLYK